MLDPHPLITKREKRRLFRRNITYCTLWWCISIAGFIFLLYAPELPTTFKDGELIYNRYLFTISISCISALLGTFFLLRTLCNR